MENEENVFYISSFSIISKGFKVFFDSVFLMLQIQYNRPAKQQNFVYLLKATFK